MIKSIVVLIVFLVTCHRGLAQWYVLLNDSMLEKKEKNILYNSYYGPMYSETSYNKKKVEGDKEYYASIPKVFHSNSIKSFFRFAKKNFKRMDCKIKDTDSGYMYVKVTFGLNYSTGIIYASYRHDTCLYGIDVECPTTYRTDKNRGYEYRAMDMFYVKEILLKLIDPLEPLIIEENSTWGLKSPSFAYLKLSFEVPQSIMYSK